MDAKDPESVVIRPARASDLADLEVIRARAFSVEEEEFVHHLGVPHGDDYFCLVAEVDGRIAGYLSAGGSRDRDRKSYGEFYELAVDPTHAAPRILTLLGLAGWERFVDAAFGGVILWIDDVDAELTAAASELGFTPDDPADVVQRHRRRFGRAALAPS